LHNKHESRLFSNLENNYFDKSNN